MWPLGYIGAVARYHELADALRARIASGALAPGEPVPSADRLARDHGAGRDTALKALRLLRREGLLFLGRDNVVRVGPVEQRPARGGDAAPPEVVDVPAEGIVGARMPTPREREELGLPDGVPLLVVRIGEKEEIYPATGVGMRWR
ncbi:GntR family transcriptional regulator [Dactylosporangium sp. CA-092794]|uniref:GntR family transcriptional regulator n=1 Tax=Dactylosporangium sp. CA-092794 TaxID=3239929 RepID=UPI003D945BBA